MMQLMTTHLEGNFPLQRIILNYCISLGTPSSKVMKPLVEATQTMIQANPDKPAHEMTAWRCKPKRQMSNRGHCQFSGFVRVIEMEVIRMSSVWENTDPALLNEKMSIYNLVYYANFKVKYDAITENQKHGTPSGICIRQCLKYCTSLVPHIFEVTTLWYFRHSIRENTGCHHLHGYSSVQAEFDEFAAANKRLVGR
jgi:hypothetical protein